MIELTLIHSTTCISLSYLWLSILDYILVYWSYTICTPGYVEFLHTWQYFSLAFRKYWGTRFSWKCLSKITLSFSNILKPVISTVFIEVPSEFVAWHLYFPKWLSWSFSIFITCFGSWSSITISSEVDNFVFSFLNQVTFQTLYEILESDSEYILWMVDKMSRDKQGELRTFLCLAAILLLSSAQEDLYFQKLLMFYTKALKYMALITNTKYFSALNVHKWEVEIGV